MLSLLSKWQLWALFIVQKREKLFCRKIKRKLKTLEAELQATPSLKYKKLDIFIGIFQILLAIGIFAGVIAVAVLTI